MNQTTDDRSRHGHESREGMEPELTRADLAPIEVNQTTTAPAPQTAGVDWQTLMAEEMVREEIEKEDGRYLVYYRFRPRQEG